MHSPVTYLIEKGIFGKAPSFCRGVVLAENIDNSRFNAGLEEQLAAAVEAIANDPAITVEHPRISAWLDIYKTFPTPKGERIRPSIATLVSRIRSGLTKLSFISPLVAISNIISLRYLMPSGLIDLDKVTGDLVLGFADGTEQFMPFGQGSTMAVLAGEVIYYASSGRTVLCRSWNYRGGKQSGIQADTRRAVIDVDALLSVVDMAGLQNAIEDMARLIADFCGGQTKAYYLNENNPRIEMML